MSIHPEMIHSSMFDGRVDLRPEDIPLPPTRAGTMVSRVDGIQDHPQQVVHHVNHATRVPLPDSRPTSVSSPPKKQQTMRRMAATVEVSVHYPV
jgi:hypothetical protein